MVNQFDPASADLRGNDLPSINHCLGTPASAKHDGRVIDDDLQRLTEQSPDAAYQKAESKQNGVQRGESVVIEAAVPQNNQDTSEDPAHGAKNWKAAFA
ncbi:MAG: hypothetical protein ACKV19_12955 [Verrucomicrobiales bacterium]